MRTTTKPCFSNGTEFMNWQGRNCAKCFKSVHFNEKTGIFPRYKCQIQAQIEAQVAGLSEITLRTYVATQQSECPYKQTKRKQYPRKGKVSGSLFEKGGQG